VSASTGSDDRVVKPDHRRLGLLCLVVAACGTPATVVVAMAGAGGAAAAGASTIGGITIAAFAAARALLCTDSANG
jgi:hypothetical protein